MDSSLRRASGRRGIPSAPPPARPTLSWAVPVLLLAVHAPLYGAEVPDLPMQAAQHPDLDRGSARGAAAIDVAGLEAFLDGLMTAHLTDHSVTGATVAVVHEGELLFSKGYGFADADGRVPVDPATTLFRIGSTTKTFTWTAVLQLRDRGALDLDTDVNEYLDFRIPATYPEPITLRHLMTHTPGFEDRVFGLFGEASGRPRGEWLERNLPARVRPPGALPAYSNYGSALAGYIVERVSGTSWEEYVEEEILTPLGMVYATPREPLPDHLAEHMSGGFDFRDGRFVAQPFERIGAMAPAGSISASAEAMAAYMVAHLEAGSVGKAAILEPSSAREMQGRAFGMDPRVNAMGLGFYEMSRQGVRIVGHGGGTQWFFTDMALFPEERLGVFVSYNSAGGAVLPVDRFLRAFLAHYFPVSPFTLDRVPDGWAGRATLYEGRYQLLRRPHASFEKLLGLAMQLTVTAGQEGDIVIGSPLLPAMRMLEVEPGYFRSPDGFQEAVIARDERTGGMFLTLGAMPPAPAERVGFGVSPSFHLLFLLFWALTFLSALVLLPARYLLQRNGVDATPLRGPERWLRWTALGVAALATAFLITAALGGDPGAFMDGSAGGAIRTALLFPVLAIPATIVLVGGAFFAYRRGYWSPWGRAHFALFAVAAVTFLAHLHYWNLLGWRM